MMALTATPDDPDRSLRVGTFATLPEALSSAAEALTGMNFHGPRGDLVEVVPYSLLVEEARVVGSRLLALGLVPGDRVCLLAETHGDFVRAFVGSLYAGLVPCSAPLPPAFGSREHYGAQIREIARVADCRAVIAPEDFVDWLVEPLQGVGLSFVGKLADLPPDGPAPSTDPKLDGIAYLQFSSGTTGSPKGIAVTHAGLMANLSAMQAALDITGADRGMSWLPLYHDMGLVGCMLLPIAAQFSIDYIATRDFIRRPGLWPLMMSRAGATMSYAPSFGYELAARRGKTTDELDLSRWRIAGIGGDMIRPGNLADFVQFYEPHGFASKSFTPSYGMAELTLGLTFSAMGSGCRTHVLDPIGLEEGIARNAPDGKRARQVAICGKALAGHEVGVRKKDGMAAGVREIGRVFARGPSVMLGYFRNPEATKEVLDSDGWLDTGDLGFLDENGELTLTGRAKDLIIVNGRNIWPQDVEWTIEHRIEGVRDGTVVAFSNNVGHDSEQERLTVVIEHRKRNEASGEDLSKKAEALLRQVYQLSPVVALSRPGILPRTSSGKLNRSKAREMYLAGLMDV